MQKIAMTSNGEISNEAHVTEARARSAQDVAANTVAAPTLMTPKVLIPFVIVTLIWGSTWFVIRDGLGEVPVVWSVTYRFVIASLGMAALLLWRKESLALDRQGWMLALFIGFAQFVVNYNFVYEAERYITSGLVAVVFALLIIPNALLSKLVVKSHLSRAFLTGAAIAILGVALLLLHEYRTAEALGGLAGGGAVIKGIGFTLVAVLAASTSNVVQQFDSARRQNVFALVGWSMAIGAVMDGLFALVTVGPPPIPHDLRYWAGVSYLALAGSTLTFPLYYGIIRAVGAGPAAWSSVLIPVIAMLISTLLEGYVWTPLAIAGSLLVAVGLILAVRGKSA